MGRAQNLHATATATPPGFAIFGRRGRPENDALLARQPSAFARAEAAPLLEAAASFESERALAALAPHAERAAGRPLLEEIADLLGQRPIETAIRTREPWLRQLTNATGLSSEYAQTLVINNHKVVHIWPNGEYWQGGLGLPGLGENPRTACGQAMGARTRRYSSYRSGYSRARRGDWEQAYGTTGGQLHACKHCARQARDYAECSETRNYPPFREEQDAFNAEVSALFRAQLLATMSAGQRPGRTDLLAIAEVAYREATTEALLDAIAKDPERTLKRIAEGTPVLTHSGNWVSPPEGGGRPPAPPNRVAWLAALTPALDRAFSAAGPADSFAHYELRKLIGAVLGFAVGL